MTCFGCLSRYGEIVVIAKGKKVTAYRLCDPCAGAKGEKVEEAVPIDMGLHELRIKAAITASNGNRKDAARKLGISRSTLYRHLARLEMELKESYAVS